MNAVELCRFIHEHMEFPLFWQLCVIVGFCVIVYIVVSRVPVYSYLLCKFVFWLARRGFAKFLQLSKEDN